MGDVSLALSDPTWWETWLRLNIGHVPFLIGWLAGWVLLWSPRPLPAMPGTPDINASRPTISVIIPARNEADALPHLLAPLLAGLRHGDELIVVDDHSTDHTTTVAQAHGATVLNPPDLPAGWLGKPHACWIGAQHAHGELLVFVDADVRPPTTLLDRMAMALAAHPEEIVSVQPWHTTGGRSEQMSLLFNLAALMGVGRFTPWGRSVRPRAAFGPVLGIARPTYDAIGGHAHPDVRGRHTEDIALARRVGGAHLHTGAPDIAFRMYPGGLRDLVRGWTRSVATGARSGPWWATTLTAAWVTAVAGALFVSPLAYVAVVVQLAVLGPRAGSFRWWTALVYPVALVVFVGVFLRSAVKVMLRRPVEWKSRQIPAR